MSLPISGHPTAGPQPISEETRQAWHNEWKTLVEGNDLVLFMKGTPEEPRCGFSARAAAVLQQLNVPFQSVNILDQPDPWTYIQEHCRWAQFPTHPQVYVKGELIGGSDIALEMYESGELQEMLQA